MSTSSPRKEKASGVWSVKHLKSPLRSMLTQVAKSATVTPARDRNMHSKGWLTYQATRTSVQRTQSKTQRLLRFVKKGDIDGIRKIAHTIAPEDINTPDRRGNTALYYAAQSSLRLTQLLVSLGATVNKHCEAGNTPLHAALAADNDTIANYLLRQGADPACRNRGRKVPSQVASDRLAKRLEVTGTVPLTTSELLVQLKPRSLSTRIRPEKRKKQIKKEVVLYPLPRSIRENRLLLRNKGIRRNSPLYPTAMRSGVQFRGECLSPMEDSSP